MRRLLTLLIAMVAFCNHSFAIDFDSQGTGVYAIRVLSVDYFEALVEVDFLMMETRENAYVAVEAPNITTSYFPNKVQTGRTVIQVVLPRSTHQDQSITSDLLEIRAYHGEDVFLNRNYPVKIAWPGPDAAASIMESAPLHAIDTSTVSLIHINRHLPECEELIKRMLQLGVPIEKIRKFGNATGTPSNNILFGRAVAFSLVRSITTTALNNSATFSGVAIRNGEDTGHDEVWMGGYDTPTSLHKLNRSDIETLTKGNFSEQVFHQITGYTPPQEQEVIDDLYTEAYRLLDSSRGDDIQRAKGLLDQLLSRNPNYPKAYLELARYHMKTGSSAKNGLANAERTILIAKDIDPELADTRVLLGYVYTNQGRYEEAELEYKKAESIGTDNLWLYANWGLNFETQNKRPEAIDMYLKVLARPKTFDRNERPRYWTYQNSHLFPFLIAGKRFDLADRLFQQYATEYQNYPCIWQQNANLQLYYLFDYDKAIEYYLKANQGGCERSSATLPLAYYMKWFSLSTANRDESTTKAAYRQAEALSPSDSQIMYAMAVSENTAKAIPLLLKQGKKIDFVDDEGMTAILLAVNANNIDATRVLLELGADVKKVGGQPHFVPLVFAIHNKNADMAKLLIKSGADIGYQLPDGTTLADFARLNELHDIVDIIEGRHRS